jgi:polyhydroxybutyrate depolymerase
LEKNEVMKKYLLVIIVFASLNLFGQSYSFTYDNILRDYIVHLPTGYNASTYYPLVINMHGYTSNASQQEAYSQMDAVADTGKFIVVYPNGVSNQWNGGFGFNPTVDDVGFLSAMIDTLKKNFSVDSTKVFACGLSAGGFMSYRLACQLPYKIAAIAPVSGLMADSVRLFFQNNCPVPLMYFHGTSDGVVYYNGLSGSYVSVDSTIKIWVGKDACLTTPVTTNMPDVNFSDGCTATRYVYSPGQNSSEVIFFKIINGGHTWPGGIPVPSLGNTNEDINASGEIWNFFRRHSLQCSIANGISEALDADVQVSVFPNPSSDNVTVKSNKGKINTISIYSLLGEKIKTVTSKSPMLDVKISDLQNGIYFLRVETEKTTSVIKLLKN